MKRRKKTPSTHRFRFCIQTAFQWMYEKQFERCRNAAYSVERQLFERVPTTVDIYRNLRRKRLAHCAKFLLTQNVLQCSTPMLPYRTPIFTQNYRNLI